MQFMTADGNQQVHQLNSRERNNNKSDIKHQS